jgi:tetratricopeptide (TPR) repeat protein
MRRSKVDWFAGVPAALLCSVLAVSSSRGANAPAPADTSGVKSVEVPTSPEEKEKRLVEIEQMKRQNTKSTDPKEVEIDRLLGELKKDPKSYDTQYKLGNAYQDAGHTHSALAAYNEAVKLDPKQSRAWVNRGVVLKDLGRTADAEESFRKALAANPADALANVNLGDELLTQKKYQEAVDAYRKAIATDPNLPNAYYSLAIAFAESGLYRDAARSWRKCAELSTAAGTPSDKENADRAIENAKLMDEIIGDAEKALKDREDKKKELEGAQQRAAAKAAAGAPAEPEPAPPTGKNSTQ